MPCSAAGCQVAKTPPPAAIQSDDVGGGAVGAAARHAVPAVDARVAPQPVVGVEPVRAVQIPVQLVQEVCAKKYI